MVSSGPSASCASSVVVVVVGMVGMAASGTCPNEGGRTRVPAGVHHRARAPCGSSPWCTCADRAAAPLAPGARRAQARKTPCTRYGYSLAKSASVCTTPSARHRIIFYSLGCRLRCQPRLLSSRRFGGPLDTAQQPKSAVRWFPQPPPCRGLALCTRALPPETGHGDHWRATGGWWQLCVPRNSQQWRRVQWRRERRRGGWRRASPTRMPSLLPLFLHSGADGGRHGSRAALSPRARRPPFFTSGQTGRQGDARRQSRHCEGPRRSSQNPPPRPRVVEAGVPPKGRIGR